MFVIENDVNDDAAADTSQWSYFCVHSSFGYVNM